MIQCIVYFAVIAKSDHGKWDSFPLIVHSLQLLIHFVYRMIITGRKQDCTLVEKCGKNCIQNRICLPCSRRSLNISERILHGIIDCQQLIQIEFSIEKRQRILSASDRTRQKFSKEGVDWRADSFPTVHIHNP